MFNPEKTKTIRELGSVDISSIKNDILSIPEEIWDAENKGKPNKFVELNETRHIVFRFVHNFEDCTNYYDNDIWEEWKDRLLPLLKKAVEPYGYQKGQFSRIMLARLKAGGSVKIHKDGNRAATFPHKIHIPIQTNEKARFFVNPKFYHFTEGHAYEVNNLAHHYAENLGKEDRIHIIFEYFNPEHIQ